MDIKAVGVLIGQAAAGASEKEAVAGGAVAVVGTMLSAVLGGWDMTIKLLIALMIMDYITGLLGAIKQKRINSDIMFWGGIRKAVVLVVIALAVMLDQLAGADAPVFRTIAIYFYAGREGLSVVENLGVIGIPLPPEITTRLQQLKGKGDNNADRN